MLYQNVRPRSFSEVVGNRSTVSGLKSVVKRDPKDRPHTILLSGPKGCGKSTLARILAKEFGTKDSNIQILNAANTRGIETVREVIEEMKFSPLGGGSTTYILDECHGMTLDAQRAFLEDTENTPLHVYFILTTTNPEKIHAPLKNRATEYKVEKLKSADIVEILKRACKLQEIEIDEEILELIASNCDRTPRSALVLLEKIQDIKDPDELADIIASEIQLQEDGDFFTLCQLLITTPEKRKKNWKKVVIEVEKLDQEPEAIRVGIMSFMRKQLLKIDPTDIEYAKDLSRILDILGSTNIFYGKKNSLVALITKICLFD